MTRSRVAVIGGGLAGLAAAARLRALHVDATLFESQPEVGGMVRSEHFDDWIIESGPPLASEPDPVVRALLDDCGAAAWTVRANELGPARWIVHDGTPVPVPRSTAAFSDSPLLSLAGRLRLLKERFVPTARVAEESVDSFARRRYGDEIAERMFDPLVASTSAGDPRELLARYAFPAPVGHEQRGASGLQASARERMLARRRARSAPPGSWTCADGMQQLPRALAGTVGDVRAGVRVTGVSRADAGFHVDTAAGKPERFHAVIFAVPAPAFAHIDIVLGAPHRLDAVATMPHLSIAAISLGFAAPQVARPIGGSRLLIPTREHRGILSMVFPSTIFPGRAPAGCTLITTFVGGVRRPGVANDTDDTLYGVVLGELRELLGVEGDPLLRRCTVWRDALPQAVRGHGQRLAAAEAVEATTPGVAFTGAWRDGLAVSEVMLGGVRAAERLAGRLGWVERAAWH